MTLDNLDGMKSYELYNCGMKIVLEKILFKQDETIFTSKVRCINIGQTALRYRTG